MVKDKKIFITGGLGFIGFNAVLHFCQNNRVCVVDDCSRVGVEKNIKKLEELNVEIHRIDISNFKELRNVFYSFQPDIVIHLAAQVAVTLSLDNPYRDFKSNILEVPKGSIIAGDWMGMHKGNAKLDSSQERFLTVMRYGKKINQSHIQSKSYYFL